MSKARKPAAKPDEPKPRIINIMADGHIEEDLTGHVIPITPETEQAYRIIAQVARRIAAQQAKQG